MPKSKGKLRLDIATNDRALFDAFMPLFLERDDLALSEGSAGSTDAIVSLSNGTGSLCGEADQLIRNEYATPSALARLIELVWARHDGKINIGEADCVFSGRVGRPFLILAPTRATSKDAPRDGALTQALAATFDLARSGPHCFVSPFAGFEVITEIRRIAIQLSLSDFPEWSVMQIVEEVKSAIDW